MKLISESVANTFQLKYPEYKSKVDSHLREYLQEETMRAVHSHLKTRYPHTLYEPVNYIMSDGGKRIRPLLLILSSETFGGNIEKSLDAAIAIEILHNFTLVHDDIMDNADTRRGKQTIHKKWNVNTAILVGDELIALSYRSILKTKSNRIAELLSAFTDGVNEVCEGQALDKEFEVSDDVSIDDYLVMIRKKTAELLKTSAIIGAIIADANKEQIELISTYSENIGIAFQIQDDLLDVIADENEFGKKNGGDILEKKKTYLYLKALELCDPESKVELINLYNSDEGSQDKINKVINIYRKLCVINDSQDIIRRYTRTANDCLNRLEAEQSAMLFGFSEKLMNRNF